MSLFRYELQFLYSADWGFDSVFLKFGSPIDFLPSPFLSISDCGKQRAAHPLGLGLVVGHGGSINPLQLFRIKAHGDDISLNRPFASFGRPTFLGLGVCIGSELVWD